jgi:hypothetical protein
MAQSPVDLTILQTLPTTQVLKLWKAVVGSPPPCSSSREFLIAMVAWHQQAEISGGLTHRAQQALKRVKPSKANDTPGRQTAATALPVGTVLIKTYQGTRYTVTVQAKGFVFEDTVYDSLSEIARRITGTRWNGPAFFGLRTRTRKRRDDER